MSTVEMENQTVAHHQRRNKQECRATGHHKPKTGKRVAACRERVNEETKNNTFIPARQKKHTHTDQEQRCPPRQKKQNNEYGDVNNDTLHVLKPASLVYKHKRQLGERDRTLKQDPLKRIRLLGNDGRNDAECAAGDAG